MVLSLVKTEENCRLRVSALDRLFMRSVVYVKFAVCCIRGHGTNVQNNQLCASVAGVVQRINRLVSVHQYKARSVTWIFL